MRRIAVVVAALCAAAAAPVVAIEDAQGFFRVVEGAATLVRVEDGQPEAARENAPALAGDRVSLAPGARVEVILPDGHRLRLAESADLELTALARSLDQEGQSTALLLSNGALALDVPRDAFDRTRVDTGAAAVLLEPGGLYLVEIDGRGATRVVVREGRAEILTDYDSKSVEAGAEAVVEADRSGRVALYQAPPLTDVEEWARQLEAEAQQAAELRPVEPELRYAALPLQRYGSWVDGGAGYAWRPRVAPGWRPYWTGNWRYSPAGLAWSSYEPWGWVPYHYGTWDLNPTYGWLWYPGAVYRPAHVVWYWGPSYAGWVPSGYYASFYARRFGFHVSFGSGFFGVSHAGWQAYQDWNFCPTHSIGHPYQYRYQSDYRVLEHRGRFAGVDRALITADTRGLDRGRWRDAGAVEDVLVRRAHRRTGGGGDLPDVTAVVARSPEVSGSELRDLDTRDDERRVAVHRPAGPRGGGGDVTGEPAAAPQTEVRTNRVAPRRPAVLADQGIDRQGDGRNGAHRVAVERGDGRGAVSAAGAGAAPTTDPAAAQGGGAALRAHRSPGFEARPGAAGAPAEGVSDRRLDVAARPSAGRPPAPQAAAPRVLRRSAPTASDEQAAPARDDRSTVERAGVAPRAVRERPVVDRLVPVTRSYAQRPVVDRSAPSARSYAQPPTVDRSAPRASASTLRPTYQRAAPSAPSEVAAPSRAPVDRSSAPRPRPQVERSYAAPAPRARIDGSNVVAPRPQVERLYVAPAPRARIDRSNAAAPRAQIAPSYAAPPARARVERSFAPPSAPAPRVTTEQRIAPARAAAPAPAPRRMESPRAAPAARSESAPVRGSGGGEPVHQHGGGQAKDSGGGGGGAHARSRH